VTAGLGHELQRLDVARPHDPEVAVIERRRLRFVETLDDRKDRRVDEADIHVGVPVAELADARIVLRPQLFYR
jgi:hypothetical protein